MKRLLCGVSLLPFVALAGVAHAAAADGAAVSEVIVTGTRQTGLKAADSPAPVQVLGSDALKRVGQPDLIQSLQQNLPSFNSEAFGTDTDALTLSAQLRGLNPNNTLVMIDGTPTMTDRKPLNRPKSALKMSVAMMAITIGHSSITLK